jgi:tRNA-dihydrouridine synthase B
VQTPVTVKTRLGWDEKSIQIVDVAKMVEDCGAQALTIHCRTRAQGHSGAAEYKWIPEVKNAVQIPIIVNGDITTPQIAKQVFEETGCDGVMIGRGAINNPWIFYEIKHYFRTGELLPPVTIFERIETMKEHLQLAIEHKGERRGVMEFRKYYSGYLRSAHSVAALRTELMKYVSVEEVVQTIDWYARKIEENNEAPFAVSG